MERGSFGDMICLTFTDELLRERPFRVLPVGAAPPDQPEERDIPAELRANRND